MSATTATNVSTRTRTAAIPIIEIFGPTIQGEGAEAGIPTHFIRVGGCDYRCSWCDTMYAVDPLTVKATAEALTADEIVSRVDALSGRPNWVTISGGNPALHKLGDLVSQLHDADFRISVETQGSRWADWLSDVDRLTISPKPPSSGMATARHLRQFELFMDHAYTTVRHRSVLKIVAFDETDLNWARETAKRWADLPLFLSAGTPMPAAPNIRDAIGDKYRWLCEAVSADSRLAHARVLPQLHAIAWKGATGV